MKRLTIAMMLLIGVALSALGQEQKAILASCSETANVVKWTYTISNGGVVLGGRGKTAVPKDTSGGLVIPDKIDGKPVCGIGERAFEFCRGLASVEIPLSVTNIVRFAFRGCSGLKSVNIPSRVASIGDFAFCECSELKSVTIPSSVTNIGEDAFLRCCELEAFFVDGKNTAYCSIDGLLYDKNMRLISCPAGKIGAISLPSGVKDIGGHAFYWCGGLTSVSIPSGVANIGAGAFWACRGLKSVTIPEGVTNIENMAFGWCGGLTSVVMPSSVTRIGFGAFECCSNLTAATIPSNVTSIDLAVFARCSQLNAISVDTNNSAYCSVDGLLYDKSMKLISCPEGKTGALTLPQGVTSLGDWAFRSCSGLTSVMIPSSVKNVGSYAFRGCTGLKSATISEGVTSIWRGAFGCCSNLTSMTIPSSVTDIGSWAFGECSGLKSVTILSGETRVARNVFEGCGGLKSVMIPPSVSWMSATFPDAYASITNVVILNGMNKIRERAFRGCCGLMSVVIPPGVTDVGEDSFRDCSGLVTVTVPSSVVSIAKGAFGGCNRLETIYVDEGDENRVKKLLLSGGASVDKLKFIEKSKSGQSSKIFTEGYGGDVRANSSSAALSQIFAKVLPGYTFRRSKMKGCRVDRVSPDGFWTYRAEDSKTNEVAWADFYKRYPADFKEAIDWFSSKEGTNVLGGCSDRVSFLRHAANVIDECCSHVVGAKEYCVRLRLQADELKQALRESTRAESAKPTPEILAKKLAEGSAAVQTGEVKKVAKKKTHPQRMVNLDMASMDLVIRMLQYISPRFVCNGVMNYMPVSFRSASGVPMTDSQVVSMACEALRMNGVSFAEDGNKVHIGRGVPTTSTPMWASSAQLKDDFMRAFKSTNENVPVDASWNFQSALPSDVAGLLADTMKMALIFCPGLPRERISCACDGMTAYDAASKLYDELIAKKVALFEFEPGIWKATPKKDAYETFSSEGKTYVRIVAGAEKYVGDIVIPSSIGGDPVVSVGSGAFGDCSLLTSVSIPSGVTHVAPAAFRGCKKLKSVAIPSSVTSIGMNAFKGCSGLTSVTIPSSVTSIGDWAFDGCSRLATLTIPSLKGCVCSRDGALRSVTIPEGVTSIEREAFRDFGGIEKVTIPNGVENIDAMAFYGCSGLKSVTIPTSVTNIGHEAFAACSRLESVTIPSSVTSLGENAFSRCPKLTTVCVVRDGKEEQLTINEFKEQWKSRMVDRTSIESRRQAIAHGKEKNVRMWKDPQTEITWCYSVCKDNTASLKPSLCFSKGMPTLSGDVVIPEILDGHVVTDIVWWDIGYCVDLTSLRIPKTVRQLRMNSASVFTLTNLTIEAGCGYSRSIGRFVLEETWLQAVCAGGTRRLVIPDEVEGLVEGCFAGASWLEEVRIPSTVKKVAASAFAGCKGLYRRYDPDGRGYMVFDGWLIPDGNIKCRELEVPLGVRHIASTEYPERCWKNVTSVKFPEGLVSIGEGAFVGSNIETIEFPGSLKRCDGFGKAPLVFGRRVVSDRPLRNVIFNSGDASFCMPDSVRRVTFADGVTDIGVISEGQSRSGLSGGSGVETVVLPAGLRSIHALPDFPELTEITIPSSVTNIGKTVFQGCKKLLSVGVEKNGAVELVPIDEFRRKWNLLFPDGCLHLTDAKTGIRWIVRDGAPYKKGSVCTLVGIEDGQDPSVLTIPETIAGMSVVRVDWDYFLQSKSRSWRTEATSDAPPARTNELSAVELRIPRTLEYIDLSAVARIFPKLQSLGVEEGGDKYSSSDGVLCKSGTAVCCPRNRKGRVVLGEGIWRIDRAFSNCTNLTEVVLPASIREIDSGAFSGCSRLEKLHLPEGLFELSGDAFDGCVKLFEKAKRYDGFYVLDGWAINPRDVGEAELGDHDETLILPGGLRGIADGTFSGCTNLLSVTFPKSLTYIGDSAFAHANIRTLELPEGVRSVGYRAFWGCTNLMSVSIPSSIGEWDSAFFYDGSHSSTFAGCTRLTSVHLAEGLRVLPLHGFSGCSGLESVAIPSSVTNDIERLGSTAPSGWFSSCPSLREVCVSPEHPWYKSIDGIVYAKGGKSLLCCPDGKRSVAIPDGVEIIGDYAFDKCSAIETIELPMSVTNIGKHAFYGCSGLKSVTIPEGVKQIGDCAFGNCRRLTEIRMPSTVREIGLLALEGDSVPERILTAPGDAERILGLVLTNGHSKLARMRSFQARYGRQSKGVGDRQESRFVVEGDALVRTTSGFARWRDPETGIAWLYSVQGDDAVDVRTEFLEGYKGRLEVPAQLGGKQVSGLLGLYGGGDVTSLSLPMSVTNIKAKVLESCTKLKSVKMNVDGELKTIGIEDLRKQWDLSWSKKPALLNLRKGGSLRARRLQRQQQETAAKVQTDAAKAQREAERAEQREQLLAIQEELNRAREAKAAAEEKQKGM